jgi:hypothetical protein
MVMIPCGDGRVQKKPVFSRLLGAHLRFPNLNRREMRHIADIFDARCTLAEASCAALCQPEAAGVSMMMLGSLKRL